MEMFILGLLSIGYIIMVALFTGIGYLMNGYVLMTLWGWFIPPLFGLPVLTLPCAIGLTMIVGFLTGSPTTYYETKIKEKDYKSIYIVAFGTPLITLGAGWIVHLFI